LARFFAPAGVQCVRVPVERCLHLKTACTEAAPGLILLNPEWVSRDWFRAWSTLDIDPAEPFSANVLAVNGRCLVSAEYPRTAARLAAEGVDVIPVPTSEFAKAEGGLTCLTVWLR
jgi:dimethylargininase